MQSSEVLRVDNLSKSYVELSILESVTFGVQSGQAVAVIGSNGAGKSTLLRCIVGAEAPDSGDVLLDDEPLRETSPSVRAAVATLLDDADYFPDLSVIEHLRLLAWAHGTIDVDSVVESTVAELELAPLRDRLPATLSGGQRHRLGLASCLVRPRKLLVLDEPEQRLDSSGVTWLIGRLGAEKTAGIAVVFASHSETLVGAVADTVLRIGT